MNKQFVNSEVVSAMMCQVEFTEKQRRARVTITICAVACRYVVT